MLVALLLVLFTTWPLVAQNCSCGEGAITPISYSAPPDHDRGSDFHVEAFLRGDKFVVRATAPQVDADNDGIQTFESTDHGRTWSLNASSAEVVYRSFSHPEVSYELRGDRLWRSDDAGQNWTMTQASVDGERSEALAHRVSGDPISHLRLTPVAIDPSEARTLYAFLSVVVPRRSDPQLVERRYEIPGLYVSRDGGNTWSLFGPALTKPDSLLETFPVLGISPSNTAVMLGPSVHGLLRTRDGGKSWSPVGQHLALVALAEIDGQKTVEAEMLDRGHQCVTDGSVEWRKLQVYQVEFNPRDERIVFLRTSKGLYRSVDGGDSWCLLDLGLRTYDPTTSLAINPGNPNELFVGTIAGIYQSNDGGCRFKRVLPPAASP